MNRKVIVSCAVTGSAETVDKNPAVPVTPRQIADAAIAAARAGAAIAHIHVRDPDTGAASMDPALYRQVVEHIRGSGVDLIINLTTGPGARFLPDAAEPWKAGDGTTLTTPDERIRHVLDLKPEVCSLDVATFNMNDRIMLNTRQHLMVMADAIRAAGAKPELEVFDSGHISLARRLMADGHIDSPAFFQICLGIPWGATATTESMLYMRDLLPADAVWSGFGISSAQMPMVAQAVLLGGHVRVGLEDNLYLERGVLAPSNAALVERAVEIITRLGAFPASPAEARAILGLA
jgi:uncharacterized protein (DUF849 family)